MAKQIDLIHYSLRGPSGQVDLEISDLVTVKQSHAQSFIQSLLSFTTPHQISGFTELELKILLDGEEEVVVRHDYSSNKVEIITDDGQLRPGDWLVEQVGAVESEVSPVWLSVLAPDQINREVKRSLEASESILQQEIPEELLLQAQQVSSQSGQRYLELVQQIKELQSQIDLQKQADDAQLNMGEMEESISEIEKSMVAVEGLLERKNKLELDMKKYEQMIPAELKDKAQELKQQALRERSKLMLEESKVGKTNVKQEEVVLSRLNKAKAWLKRHLLLISLTGILFLGGIGFGLLWQYPVMVIVGAMGGAVELVILVVINRIPSQISSSQKLDRKIKGHQETIANEIEKLQVWLNSMQQFFIDKAWLQALSAEMEEIGKSVEAKMGDAEFQKFRSQKQKLQRNLAHLRVITERQSAREIAPDEYLRKRRQMDVLKLDRSRLERELRDQSTEFGKLKELAEKLEEKVIAKFRNLTPDAIQELAELTEVKALQLKDNRVEVILNDGSIGDLLQLDPVNQFMVYAWLKFANWEALPVTPLFILNIPSELPDDLRSKIDAKISQISAIGQVVRVKVIA